MRSKLSQHIPLYIEIEEYMYTYNVFNVESPLKASESIDTIWLLLRSLK